QPDAISRISRAIQAAECDLNDRGPRPKGTFLFMGSRGIGKTESSKAFTEYLFGSDRLTMVPMNEFTTSDSKAALVRKIREAVNRDQTGTLLFDEIEKAHRDNIDLFISLLDEGQIMDEDGSWISV